MQDSKMRDADKKAENILRKWGEIQKNNNAIKSLVKNNPDILRRRLGWFSDYINSFEKEITQILSVVSADYATRLLVTLAKAYYHCAYCKQTLKENGVREDVAKMDECFNRAIIFAPTDHILLSDIAKFYYEGGKYRQAAIHYKNSFSSASNPFTATKAMANAVDAHWSNGDSFLAVFTGIGIPARFVVSTVRTTVVGGSAGIVNIAKWVVDQCLSSKKDDDKKSKKLPPKLAAKQQELLQHKQDKLNDSEVGDAKSITAVAPVVADEPTEISAVALTSSARKKKEKKPPKKRTGNSTATAAHDESGSPKLDEKFSGEDLGFNQNHKSSKKHRRKKKTVQQQLDASSESSSESDTDQLEVEDTVQQQSLVDASPHSLVHSTVTAAPISTPPTPPTPPTQQQSSVNIAPAAVLFVPVPIITTDNKQLVARHSKGKSLPPRDAKTALSVASVAPIVVLSEDEKQIKDAGEKLKNPQQHTQHQLKAALEKLLLHGKAYDNYLAHIKKLPLFINITEIDNAWLISELRNADAIFKQPKGKLSLLHICAAITIALTPKSTPDVDEKIKKIKIIFGSGMVMENGKDIESVFNDKREQRNDQQEYAVQQAAINTTTATAAAPAKNTMN